jgi:hypothetical protein
MNRGIKMRETECIHSSEYKVQLPSLCYKRRGATLPSHSRYNENVENRGGFHSYFIRFLMGEF